MLSQKKTLTKRIGGLKAKRNGESFENLVMQKARSERVKCFKIPSGCRWVRGFKGARPIPEKTPFDFFACYRGKTIFFDAKTVQKTTFPYSAQEPHQVACLAEIEAEGLPAGYLIHFAEIDRIGFFKALTLKTMKPRASIEIKDGFDLGDSRTFSLLKLFEMGFTDGKQI
jgi:hypothetical protein